MKREDKTQAVQREREVFLAAIELDDPGQRAAYLEQACAGDEALRRAVEELVGHSMDDEFLQTAVFPSATTQLAGASARRTEIQVEQVGDQLGPYRLLQKIGEGGVGIVYLAEQEEPVRRRVAIKILKPGIETKSVIARFESESQALALMDHPNVARVLDAGTTGFGRPFFVMDLVRGTRITDYCDDNQLSTRERLELFLKVCQAVQHAHQKGIIHRDIKPSNILVTLHDGVPVPKVIDFGIAKAIEQKLTDKTVLTEFHSFIGTPAYISPEQAEMSGLDIDTRADIYSLGVLLYELLTGKTPFDARELVASGLDGMRRTIREVEPIRPSTKLRTMLAVDRTRTASRQRVEPAMLTKLLQGDLDWIILKSLEKDRTRRYETANGLAADVRRYLDNQPVIARPPSSAYRLAKFIRRNRVVSTAVAAFVGALAVGLGFTTWQWAAKSEAYRRLALSEQQARELGDQAEKARQVAEHNADEALRNAYAADMNLAQQALALNNLGRARELLERFLPPTNAPAGQWTDLRGWEWRYLWQQCRSDALFNLTRLSNSVAALSVSADGHWVAAGEHLAAGISVWDLRSRREVVRFPAREFREPLQFSPTVPLLAISAGGGFASAAAGSATREKQPYVVRLWDGSARRFTAELALPAGCRALQFSADGSRLAVVTEDLSLTIWDVAGGNLVEQRKLQGTGGSPGRLGYSPGVISRDLRRYAHPVESRRVQVFDLSSGEELWSEIAADEGVMALALSPDGALLATGGGFVESVVRIWDVAGGVEIAQLQAHRTYVRNIAFWPDGQKLATASGDQTIHLWDASRLHDLVGHASAREGKNRFWRPYTFTQPNSTLKGHQDEVWSLALAPDPRTLISGGKDGAISVWDTAASATEHAPFKLSTTVREWAFTPDSQALLVFDSEGWLARWQGDRFQERTPMYQFNSATGPVHISPDGRLVAASRADKAEIEVLNLDQCTVQFEIGSAEDPQLVVAFLAAPGQLITRQPKTGSLLKWDVNTGTLLERWEAGGAGLGKVHVSPGGEWLLHLDQEGTGHLWNTKSRQKSRVDSGMRQIHQAAFSPDETQLAFVNWLGFAQVWAADPPQQLAAIRGFLQGQHSVTYSPDGRRIAIGSNAREAVKLWDTQTFQELVTLEGNGSLFMSVAFSPDGNVLAACNDHGELHVWRALPPEAVLPFAGR